MRPSLLKFIPPQSLAQPLLLCIAFCIMAVSAESLLHAQRQGRPGNGDARNGNNPGNSGGDERRSRDSERSKRREEEKKAKAEEIVQQLAALDANKNGRLEPGEANGMSSAVLQKIGMDPNNAVTLATIEPLVRSSDLRRLRYGDDAGIDVENAEQGVPSFAVDVPAISPVMEFGVSSNPILADKRPLAERYSLDILKQVEGILKQYDRNNDRTFDPDEIKLIPWGEPKPEESDLDKNGFLTEVELCERLQQRAGGGSARSPRSSRDRSERNRDEKKEPADQQAAREQEQARRQTESRERKQRLAESARRRQTSANDETDRIAMYVEQLMKKYDTNSDKKLDSTELKEMRSVPRSGDLDKDGVLSYDELYTHYNGGKPASENKAKETSATTELAAVVDIPGAIRWSGPFAEVDVDDPKELPNDLKSKDKNGDKQVAMAEFSNSWDQETLDKFYALDTNRDGFITLSESNSGGAAGSASARSGSRTSSSRRSRRGRSGSSTDSEGQTDRKGAESKGADGKGQTAAGNGDAQSTPSSETKALPSAIRFSGF